MGHTPPPLWQRAVSGHEAVPTTPSYADVLALVRNDPALGVKEDRACESVRKSHGMNWRPRPNSLRQRGPTFP